MEPQDCQKDPFENSAMVVSEVGHLFNGKWNQVSSFSCWGLDEEVFYLENHYSVKKANVALFVPLIFTIGLPILAISCS